MYCKELAILSCFLETMSHIDQTCLELATQLENDFELLILQPSPPKCYKLPSCSTMSKTKNCFKINFLILSQWCSICLPILYTYMAKIMKTFPGQKRIVNVKGLRGCATSFLSFASHCSQFIRTGVMPLECLCSRRHYLT